MTILGDTAARLWHPWLRINRVLRMMLHERWNAEAWPQVKAEFEDRHRPARNVVEKSAIDSPSDARGSRTRSQAGPCSAGCRSTG